MKAKDNYYSGMGFSGLADGIEVRGELIETKEDLDYSVIICERTGYHTAVITKTLRKL